MIPTLSVNKVRALSTVARDELELKQDTQNTPFEDHSQSGLKVVYAPRINRIKS